MSLRLPRSVGPRFLAVVATGFLFPLGCAPGPAAAPAKPAGAAKGAGAHAHSHSHDHEHGAKGPHEGALVVVGEDDAHLEVALDPATGRVTVWVLDAAAKHPLPIKADSLNLTFVREHSHEHDDEHEEGAEEHHDAEHGEDVLGSVTLQAVSPDADGNASEFAGEAPDLKGAKEFDAVIESITIAGRKLDKIEFNWPEGNDHHHH